MPDPSTGNLEFVILTDDQHWPAWCSRSQLVTFLHETMKPYEDTPADIGRSLDYAFCGEQHAGGFVLLGALEGKLAGAVVMLNTGMGGYVPEHLLLFISVDPQLRGKGIGGQLMERCFAECHGSVKLHVDFDNPARHLYERMGMKHVYAEMRVKL